MSDLRAAAESARLADVCAARVLIVSGKVDIASYYEALAFELGVPFIAGWPAVDMPVDARAAFRTGCLRLESDGLPRWLIAPEDGTLRSILRARTIGWPGLAIAAPPHFAAIVCANAEAAIQTAATDALPRDAPKLSAKGARESAAALVVLGAGLIGAGALVLVPHLVGALLGLLFLGAIGFRLAVGAEGLARQQSHRDIRPLSDAELPAYSVLVALRDEAAIVPDLLTALAAIDYPRSKLEALLIVEPEDSATRTALAAARLPPWMRVLVGPHDRTLRTKPRALNIGLMAARGTLLTVYDAEDRPAPDQLRRAALAFANDPDLDCVQAQLAIDNGDGSWLPRLFAIEYAALFDVFNLGMARLRLPLPLGGTSNHFQIGALRAVGGWDAWNVTEDADLGLRLARFGYRTDCLDSTTLEAAPDDISVWMKQRRRWMKGWVQTFLVLARAAPDVARQLGMRRWAALGLLFVNLVAGPLLFPLFFGGVVYRLWAQGLPHPTGAIQVGETALAVSVFLIGPVSTLWFGYAGARKRHLLRFLPSLPLLIPYQFMISAAAWISLVDLVVRPYHWHKTRHRAAAPRAVAARARVIRSSRVTPRRRRMAPPQSLPG